MENYKDRDDAGHNADYFAHMRYLWLVESTHIQVDFNEAFRDLICTMGTSGERMIMGSVVNTFLSAEGATTMTVTVNGEVWESGHVIYDFPMEFFE